MKLIELQSSVKVLDFNYGSLVVYKNKIINPYADRHAKAYKIINSTKDPIISPLINFEDIIIKRETNYLTFLVSSEEKKIIETFDNPCYAYIKFENNKITAYYKDNSYPKFLIVRQKGKGSKPFNLLFKNVCPISQPKNQVVDEYTDDFDIGNLDSEASEEELEIDNSLLYSASNVTTGLNKVNTISFLAKYYPHFKISMDVYQKIKSHAISFDEEFWKLRLEFCQDVIKTKKLSTSDFPGKDIFFSFPASHCIRTYIHTFLKISSYDFQISQNPSKTEMNLKNVFKYFRLATMSADGDSFFNCMFILFFTLDDSKLIEKQASSCRNVIESVIFITRCCLILCNKNITTLVEDKVGNKFYSRLIKLHRSIRIFEYEVTKQVTCSFNWETITASIGLRSVHISAIQNTYNSIKSELLRVYELFCNRYKKNISLHLNQFFSNLAKCNSQDSQIWKRFSLFLDIEVSELKDYSDFSCLLISFLSLSTPYPQRCSFMTCLSLSNIYFHHHFKYENSYFLEIRLKYNRKSRDHFFNSIYLHKTASKLLAFWILVLKPSILHSVIKNYLEKINKGSTDEPIYSFLDKVPFQMSATLKYVLNSSPSFTHSKKIPVDYYKEILFAYFHPNSLSIQLPTSQKISLVMSNHSNKHLYGSHFIRQVMPLFGVYIMEQYPTAVMAACASHTLIQHGLGHTQSIASRYYANDGIDQFLVSKRRFAEICFIWCMFFENTTYKIPVLDLKVSAANEAEFLDEEEIIL